MTDFRLWHLRLRKLWWTLRQHDRCPLLWRRIAPSLEHTELLGGYRFATVVDVGANVGQFALFALEQLSPQKMVCIEPQPCSFGHVEKRAAAADCELTLVTAALSNRAGVGTLMQTMASDSSSLLSPVRAAAVQHRSLRISQAMQVPLQTADELLLPKNLPRPILLKLDVQGTELDALQGASEFLRSVDAVLVEVSFAQLYEGQARPHDVIRFLADRGFSLSGTAAVPGGGTEWQLDQADLIFDRLDPR